MPDTSNQSTEHHSHRICIAPMLDWSDRHCRYFWRLLTRRSRLYTEMITTGAILHGDRERHLSYDNCEHPVAVQLGGSDPEDLASSAEFCANMGYDEINLNVGCPSDRVQSGAFGACLMLEPEKVARCIAAMRAAVDIPVTIKCRIGVDESDSFEALQYFVSSNIDAGCDTFIVHARKAWLSGLSPKQNREIPPLSYPTVYQLKQLFPEQAFVLNGGVKTLDDCEQHLQHLDGVMIGREAYQNPMLLAGVDAQLFGEHLPAEKQTLSTDVHSALQVAKAYATYIDKQLARGEKLHHLSRHTLGLFNGVKGARAFRRHLSENASQPGADAEVFHQALEKIRLDP